LVLLVKMEQKISSAFNHKGIVVALTYIIKNNLIKKEIQIFQEEFIFYGFRLFLIFLYSLIFKK